MKNFIWFLILSMLLTACATSTKKEKTAAIPVEKAAESRAEIKEVRTPEKPVVIEPLVTVYTVEANDTLGKIAKLPAVYSDVQMWPVLFEANRNVLSDPSKIYPGQKLRIPRDPEEIKKLKEQAKVDETVKSAYQVKPKQTAVKPVSAAEPKEVSAVKLPAKQKTSVKTVSTPTPIRTYWTPPPSIKTAETVKKADNTRVSGS